MKKTGFFLIVVLLISVLGVSAQVFQQLGSDIDGEAAGDHDGGQHEVSLSADGTRVAIGGPSNSDVGAFSGHVRIFEFTDGKWVQLGADIDGDESNNKWGSSVSLSGDGDRVAVGSDSFNDKGINTGQARVYEYSEGTWVQLGSNIVGEAGLDYSGDAVALSADGNRLAVGAALNDGNGEDSGHVRVFEYTAGNWVQLGADIDGEAAGDRIGTSVSLNSDGMRLAAGAMFNDGNGEDSGHVRIYEYLEGNWVQLGDDIDGEAAGDKSGQFISLSSDGTIIAIGAPLNDGNGEDSGHVRVFEYSAGNWVQLGNDINGEAAGDLFRVVSLSSDGARVAIGGDQNDGNGQSAGHVRVFEYTTNDWVQLGADIDGEAAGDNSGNVSLSANGRYVAIGARNNDGNGDGSGHVRVYGTEAFVDITVVGSGIVEPASGIYALGTNLLFSASPDVGWLFMGWTGDLSTEYDTPITNLLIDISKNITATFSDDADNDGILNSNETAIGTDPRKSDTDGDGLSDSQELYTYSTDPLVWDMDKDGLSDGAEILVYSTLPKVKDTDEDGFEDGFEVSTGFDPTLDTSTPELYSTIQTAVEFKFYAVTGTSYRIEATDVLSNSWQVIEPDVTIDQGTIVQRFYSTEGQSNRFFRALKN